VGMQTSRFASGRAENTSFVINMLHNVQHVYHKATYCTMLSQAKPAFGSGTRPEMAAPRNSCHIGVHGWSQMCNAIKLMSIKMDESRVTRSLLTKGNVVSGRAEWYMLFHKNGACRATFCEKDQRSITLPQASRAFGSHTKLE